MTVPWYLMAAYAYYVDDDPILSDYVYDHMIKKMVKEWDRIEHIHKHFIELDALRAGTFLGEYPSKVPGAVKELRKGLQKKQFNWNMRQSRKKKK
jgi:hypothetical protein